MFAAAAIHKHKQHNNSNNKQAQEQNNDTSVMCISLGCIKCSPHEHKLIFSVAIPSFRTGSQTSHMQTWEHETQAS